MEHILDDDFWDAYAELPLNVQRRVPQKFQLLRQNPKHPSLRFKKVRDLWAIRVSRGYRALAREEEGAFIWFWVGTHGEYERRIR
ncbi:MAG: hypothetical protein OXI43_13695 [Candidatus Poribacteria bacterium]|nr:hypothetical protein [Candidatus Poribacteria bacterium]